GPSALFLKEKGKLGCSCSFTGTLKANHHHYSRGIRGKLYAAIGNAKKLTERVMHYFDYLLSGREAFQHLFSYGSAADVFNKVFNYLEIHIGFEQGQPYLLERNINVFFFEKSSAF